jgi:oxygen-dependent protoporphyrinogen oxidase
LLPKMPKRVAIIGGGIAGLAAAHRARELDPTAEVTLFEAGPQVGGILRTVRQDGYLIETSADSFITNLPWAIDLCRRIGFADQLIPTNPEFRGAMVVAHGKLEPVPEGFVLMAPSQLRSIMRSPILSWRGKLRLACESLVSARQDIADESVASFARRRLGREAFDRLVQPLVGGIYTADPEKLSLAATLPRYLEMERQHGSLIRGAKAKRGSTGGDETDAAAERGARYSMFVAPREGLASLVDAIAARLPANCVRVNSPVERIERTGDGWQLPLYRPTILVGESSGSFNADSVCSADTATDLPTRMVGLYTDKNAAFDAIVVATSAPVAAKLLKPADAELAGELSSIEYAGSAIVILAYDRSQIEHPLNTFGFVVPTVERRKILSASFSSVKFPGRAPDGKVLIRVFIGGALQPEMLDRSDEDLQEIAADELKDLLGVRGVPELSLVYRWPQAMPQYHLGHLDRLKRIEERLRNLPGLALAGNAFEGVGIPQCIRSGEQAAERVLSGKTEPGNAKAQGLQPLGFD